MRSAQGWCSSVFSTILIGALTLVAAPASGQYSFSNVDFPGAVWTAPSKINDAGQIVGQYLDTSGHRHGFLVSGGSYTTIDCPSPYTASSGATGINNLGDVVGVCAAPGGINGTYGTSRSFLLSAGTLTLLPDIGSSFGNASTFAQAINDSGQVVGWYADGCLCNGHGFSYQLGAFTTLDVPGFGSTYAYDVNASGLIVGATQPVFGGGHGHGFLLTGSTFTVIDEPNAGPGNSTQVSGVNAAGQFAGIYWDTGDAPHGFLLVAGVFTTIDHPSANGVSEAFGINGGGTILGGYVDASSVFHGFVATPPAEDTTAPVLTVPETMTVAATSGSGATVTFAVSASDPDDAAGPVTCSPSSGATFPAGTTTVTCSSTDSHGNTGHASFSVTVYYNVCALYDASRAVKSGSTIPIKLQLCTAAGVNLSSSAIVVTATSVTYVSSMVSSSVQDAGNANPDLNFRYDATLATTGGYIFNLKTTGLASGTYALSFTITGDPTTHTTPFQVK